MHFEIAHSLDTDSFLGAFTRFTSRRGVPTHVISDNGTNLVAAEKELREMLDCLDEDKIRHAHTNIQWKFLPPHGSHMAGVWERLIRSTKQILRTLLSSEVSRPVTDEILCTLLCQVEAILNDRPLTRNPDGLEDAPALTPNMLLTFKRRPVYTPGIFDEKDVYSRRWWRRAQHLSDVFWKRWIKEYLPLLHLRQKWTHTQPDVCVDDIVLLEEENAPRGEWPIARVLELQPGLDGLTRTVKLLVRGKEKIRPIQKLVFLEHHAQA